MNLIPLFFPFYLHCCPRTFSLLVCPLKKWNANSKRTEKFHSKHSSVWLVCLAWFRFPFPSKKPPSSRLWFRFHCYSLLPCFLLVLLHLSFSWSRNEQVLLCYHGNHPPLTLKKITWSVYPPPSTHSPWFVLHFLLIIMGKIFSSFGSCFCFLLNVHKERIKEDENTSRRIM